MRKSIPSFYERIKTSFRSLEEDAYTAIWLAISSTAKRYTSSALFQNREPVPDHLLFAGTTYSEEDSQNFIIELCSLAKEFQKEE